MNNKFLYEWEQLFGETGSKSTSNEVADKEKQQILKKIKELDQSYWYLHDA
jgi:hypothetical protein